MKPFKLVIHSIIILMILNKGVSAADLLSKFSVKFIPTGTFALAGNYSDTEKLRDIVQFGFGFGLTLRYEINENFFIEADYSHSWMFIKEDKKPFAYKENTPAFIMPMYMLNGTFFLKSGYKIEPYLTIGGGICPWSFTSKALGGKSWPAPANSDENFSKSSFGLNIGLGVEWFVLSRASVIGEVKYYYIFARDENKFGTDDFTEQDFISIRLGITYYFGKI
jgi:opacity protein-like surface antigen